MEWPLSGLRVADLSAGIAGGYCTKVLADGSGPAVHNRRHSPMLGERKRTSCPGCSATAEEIAQLRRDGIIGTRPASTDSSKGFR